MTRLNGAQICIFTSKSLSNKAALVYLDSFNHPTIQP